MRKIKVTGYSTINVKPTLMRVSIKIKGSKKEFDDTVEKSSRDTEVTKKIVEKLNFDRNNLKTINFDINADYESYRDKNNDYKTKFVGFKYTHSMYIEFPIDNKLLGNLLYALVKSKIDPEFQVGYTIFDSEKEQYKNKLIENSVKNAREKAEIIAKSANVNLGKIIKIKYADRSFNFLSDMGDYMSNNRMYSSKSKSTYDFDIEPDDLSISSDVDIVWDIK